MILRLVVIGAFAAVVALYGFSSPAAEEKANGISTEKAFLLALNEVKRRKGGDDFIDFRMSMLAKDGSWKFSFHFLPLTPGDDVQISIDSKGHLSSMAGF